MNYLGFPRADIDVYQVRHARHSIRTKSNDLKDVLNKIESGLHNIHAQVLIYVKDAMETYLIWMSSPFFY